MVAKSRSYCFTWNNYPANWEEQLRALTYTYWIGGKEIAPTTGTPHIQGFIQFKHPTSLTAAKKKLPGCHVEIKKGTFQQAIAYCKEDMDWIEDGNAPMDPKDKGQAEKRRWTEAFENAKTGDFDNIPADILIRNYSAITRIKQDYMLDAKELTDLPGLWIFGPAGCGKSRFARQLFPNSYPKPLNKWWDGYKTQESVIIDDVDKTHSTWISYFLKIWGDRYPFVAEVKGTSRQIRPRAVLVTSQYSIDSVFPDNETREAIHRRYKEWEFNADFPIVFNLVPYIAEQEPILVE